MHLIVIIYLEAQTPKDQELWWISRYFKKIGIQDPEIPFIRDWQMQQMLQNSLREEEREN